MKRFLLLVLLLLLLAGCHADVTDGTEETTESQSLTLYSPNSEIEQNTAGAVRLYATEARYSSLSFMGQKLLLRSNDNKLTALTGSQAEVLATYQMDSNSPALYAGQTGIAYYRMTDNSVVTCNPMLQQTGVIRLPEKISGIPVVSLAKKEIYYCTGLQLRALDMSTGISRLLKEFSAGTPGLTGSLFDGSILICQVAEKETHYISSANGQTLSKDSGVQHVTTDAERYFLFREDGGIQQTIFGSQDSQPKSFHLTGSNVRGIPEMNGAVSCLEDDTGLNLSFYDFATGKRTASVVIPGIKELSALASDGKVIWLLAMQGNTQTLLRWDITLSPTDDTTVYTGPLHTAANPDTAGLAQCQKKADSLTKSYGLRFRLNQDALKVTGGYSFKPEYQVANVNAFLDALTPILSQFPGGFWSKTLRSGKIHLGLVREIAGEEDYVLYHKDGNAYIVFALGADIPTCLYDATGYLVDSFVLGNSRDYDDWNLLNPEGFVYGEKPSAMHLTESGRSFIDEQATKSPRDDRQRIFAYAMQADKANYFSTDTMQAKLRLVCSGIRESYGLEKQKTTYPWEQHLTEPMYKK
jgi:hypothetical protein